MTRSLLKIILLSLALVLLASCGEEETTISLETVAMPEGGSVHAVAVLDDAEAPEILAPSTSGLFRQREGSWEAVEPDWPDELPDQYSAPLRALGNSAISLNFPRSQVMTSFADRFWMALGVPGSDDIYVMTSRDGGQTWTTVELPAAVTDEAGPEAGEDGADNAARVELLAPARARPQNGRPRLLNYGADGLFLTDGIHLWRLVEDPDETDESPWAAVDLSDIEWEQPVDTPLPALLRHYLPANDHRPFELLTVLRDELFVFRRDASEEPWREVASLDDADRQLMGVPGGNQVVMLSADGLHLSTDGGTSWERIEPADLPQGSSAGVAVDVLPATDEEPITLLLSVESGAVYRSENLGGDWQEVRPSDGDRRIVTGFTYSPSTSHIWASTNGAGVLRSLDRGRQWRPINEGLAATRPFDVDTHEDDGFLLGSDAGLFRMIGSPEQDSWQMLHDRATTTIYSDARTGAIVAGTANGALVRLEPDGRSTTAEAAPFEQSGEIVYQPARFRGLELPAKAIAAIEARPDSRHIFAWSIEEGPLASVDGGNSWTRLQFNPAFRNALEGSYLASFTTDFGQRMYLITHSLDGAQPTQLWRSFNNGETWHAVSSFAQSDYREGIFIDRTAEYAPEVLFMAHRARFAKSLDGGNSWRDLSGPWTDGRILLYEALGQEHLLVVDLRHSVELLRVTNTDDDSPEVASYKLEWPEDGPRRNELRAMAVDDERIYLSTPTALLSGRLPNGQHRLPDGLAVIAIVTSIFVLTTIAFGILRWKS